MIISCKNMMLDLKAPPSKSAYHRELIVNFILGVRGDLLSIRNDDNDDVTATKRCLAALASASDAGDDDIILPVNESGSTLRFMIPAALALKGSPERKMVFKTKGRLIERPVDDLADCLAPFGVTIEKDVENSTVTAKGFLMAGDCSVQFQQTFEDNGYGRDVFGPLHRTYRCRSQKIRDRGNEGRKRL